MRSLIFFLSVSLVFSFAGCSDQTTSPDLSQEIIPTAQDIPQDVQKVFDELVDHEDGLTEEEYLNFVDPPPSDLIGNCDIYSVTFLWGNLFNAGAPSNDTTDWTGSIWMNAEGAIHVRHQIDFEHGQDSVLPRNNQYSVGWISKTSHDVDGLSFLVFIRTDVDYFTPPILTFETEPFTAAFNFHQLMMLDAFYQVDDQNGVVIHARKIWQSHCPGGTIEGVWEKEAMWIGEGSFHGVWKNRAGEPIGLMNGTFWSNEYTHGQFHGQLSGIDTDQVIAVMHGIWFYDDMRLCPICGEGHGVFRGHFAFVDGSHSGVIKGTFGDMSLPPDQLQLPMMGIWEVNCPFASLGHDLTDE
jgi:hypothetical protein